MKREPKITLELIAPIRRVARVTFEACYRNLKTAVRIEHDLLIRIAPAPAICVDGHKGFGFGVFGTPGGKPTIGIAGQKPEKAMSDCDWAEMLVETLAHELAHYEQFRDGKPLTERGVRVRSRTIAKALATGGRW